METAAFVGLAGVPFITALVWIVKPLLPDKRLLPLAALALGVLINLAAMQNGNWQQAVLVGLAAGLGASGLWSAAKTGIGQ